MNNEEFFGLSLRYFLLIALGSFNLYLFYLIFTPLTVFPAYFFLNLFYDANLVSFSLIPNPSALIFIKGFYANIIPSCVAGSAYYFLLILNLSTPMGLKKRISSIIFLISSFLILNTLRIIVFAAIISEEFQYFDQAHNITWYLGSTFLVVLIWFTNVRLFKIKDIPVFSDMKRIFEDIIRKPAKNK